MLAAVLAVCGAPAHAQQPFSSEVSLGLAWLQGQVQADGTLGNEAASLATPLQNRSEAAQTLASLASVPAVLANAVAAEADGNTEYLARQVLALTAAGRDASAQLNLLLLRRNADRGFGGGPGFESNPLDTAWTVLALARAGQGAGAVARDARAYLMASLQADGGVAAPSELVRVEYSALALFALQTAGDGSSATSVRALATWLLQRQAADGSWQGDIHLTALALIAVAPAVSDPALRAAAAAYLAGRQGAAGSWQDDPFLTALALRAIGASSASPAAATLAGQVVDQSTNLPLAGASVAVSGAGTGSATTDSEGRFSIGGLAAGTYSTQFTRSGYGAASASYTLVAGQAFDAGRIALPQAASTGIVRGQVRAATAGTPLAGVLVSISGSATLDAVTDAAGAFEFSAVPPGAITISASLSGYQSASASASLAGGVTLIFSPGLYADSETAPATGRFFGRTVVAATGAPLPGVSIALNGVAAGTTGGDGSFELTLAPETYTAVYTLSGYDSVSQGFVLVAGAAVDAGTLALSAQRTTTTLSGRVTDSDGLPLAGATVQLVGGASATTGADGAYSLGNLEGTSFDVRASATGYASQLVTLQVARPSDVVHNFALFGGSASFAIGEPAVSPAAAGANADVSVTAAVSNIGTSSASAVVMMQILDPDGVNGVAGAVIGTSAAFEAGSPVGLLQLAAEEVRTLTFTWNTGRFAAGRYDLVIRLVAPESITAATPQGSLLLERPATASVTPQTHFSGSVTANPPVLRAGTSTPVALSATLQNDGNAQLAPQAYTLSVVDTQTNALAHAETLAGPALAVSEVTELAFASWTPPAGGNFRVEVASANPAEGKVSTPLYVGDSGSAFYTTDKLVVPAGTQTVRAKVKVTGQDVESGTISDPLAPLVRTAIQRAVSYTDTSTRQWTLTNRCMGCHTQSQALVGGELNRNLATFNPRTRATIFNAVTAEQRTNGSLSETNPSFPRTMTMLGLWGLASYRDKPSIAQALKKAADFLVAQQDAAGRWFADHSSGWWQSEVTNSAFNLKNLAEMHGVLGAVDPQSVKYYATRAFAAGLNRTSRGYVVLDTANNLYFSSTNGQVVQIRPDGTFGTIWSSLSDPRGVVEFNGSLLVATFNGLRRLNADGSTTLLNPTSNLSHLAVSPDGRLFASDFGQSRIYEIDPVTWIHNMWFGGVPLNGPGRLSFTPAGDLIVPNLNARNIVRIAPDKTASVVVELAAGQPIHALPHGAGWLVSTTTGVYRYNADWEGERLLYERIDMIAPLPDGRLVAAVNGGANLKEVFVTTTAPALATSLANYATAVDKATTYLANLNVLGNSDNLILAHQIIGLGAARDFYKDSNPARAATLLTKMEQVAATLRARVRADGGWGRHVGWGTDSMVTAQVGVALDYLNPSPDDPLVRKAVQLLLNRQMADGSWRSENGILPTNQAATSWVAIWLPIILNRLGGIDTDLSVTFAPNVTMSNPDRAPTSSLVNPDGSRTAMWRLVGVTSSGQEINYDLSLADMAVNEVRPVSVDAHLTFRNSFTGGNVDAPIDIPRVTASAFLDLGVTTDRTLYGANGTVSITGQVTNTAAGLSSGSVSFEIRAPDDGLVAQLGTLPFGGLAPGASTNLMPAWNTDGTLAGPGFYVLATLYDSEGRFVGTARSTFAIVGSETGTLASARISTDKPAYLPSDTAQVLSRAANLTQNQPLDNVTLVTTVLNTDGSVRFTRSELIPQLVQNALRDFTYAVPIAFAPAGVYSGTVVLRDAGGTVLSSNTTSFTVQSTAATGSGLTGTLLATPKEVPLGDAAALAFTATNRGNGALAGLPLTLSVVDPQAEQVLAQFPETVDLAAGATHQMARSWTPSGPIGATYVAVLSAVVGGNTLTLAQDSFKVVAPPVQLDVAFSNARQARVLILLSCKYGSDEREQSGPAQQACIDQRRNFLGAYFTGLGIEHRISTTEEDFRLAFRSGAYNTYWVTGGGLKLANTLTEEVREQVFRGDAIIRDGVHDERHLYFDAEAGITLQGKLDPLDQAITLNGTLFSPGTLPSVGRPLKLGITTGQVQAVFPASADSPAIVSNQYGLGRGILFGYDLIGTAMAQPSSALDQIVLAALGWVAPQPAAPAMPRSYAVLRTRIANVGQAADLKATLTPPAGATVVSTAPVASADADGRPVWTFTLDAGATQDLDAGLRLPEGEGSHTATVAIDSVRNGITTPYGSFDLAFSVETAASIAPRVAAELAALAIPVSSEQNDRDVAVSSIQAAQSALASGDYETAISQLVTAAERLIKITSADVAPHRVEVGRIMQEAHIRWAATQP